MGSVDVYILGQKYVVKGEESPQYIEQLASFVDAKLKEVCSATPNITPLKAAILTSLNIADELHKLKNEYNSVTANIKNIDNKTDAILELFDS